MKRMNWWAAGMVMSGELLGMGLTRLYPPVDALNPWVMVVIGGVGAFWFAWRAGAFSEVKRSS